MLLNEIRTIVFVLVTPSNLIAPDRWVRKALFLIFLVTLGLLLPQMHHHPTHLPNSRVRLDSGFEVL